MPASCKSFEQMACTIMSLQQRSASLRQTIQCCTKCDMQKADEEYIERPVPSKSSVFLHGISFDASSRKKSFIADIDNPFVVDVDTWLSTPVVTASQSRPQINQLEDRLCSVDEVPAVSLARKQPVIPDDAFGCGFAATSVGEYTSSQTEHPDDDEVLAERHDVWLAELQHEPSIQMADKAASCCSSTATTEAWTGVTSITSSLESLPFVDTDDAPRPSCAHLSLESTSGKSLAFPKAMSWSHSPRSCPDELAVLATCLQSCKTNLSDLEDGGVVTFEDCSSLLNELFFLASELFELAASRNVVGAMEMYEEANDAIVRVSVLLERHSTRK